MKISKILSTTTLLCAALAANAANDAVNIMSPYVYPANKAAAPVGFTYMPDGETYVTLAPDHRSIVRYDIKSGEQTEVFLDLSNTRETTLEFIDGFSLSDDATKVLVWRDTEMVYRRSFKAEYFVYDVRSRILTPLSKNFDMQQMPVFSPNGRMVAFVADNNIYVKKLDYKTETAVTTDGKFNSIINGTSDWVYEEEFQTTCSMAWSPDNLTLCYVRYDETEVPTYDMQTYAGSCNAQSDKYLYPETWSYKYPVAGEKNSVVTLHSYDVETRKTKDLELPDKRIEYIPHIQYGPNAETLVVTTLNRDQNLYQIYKVNPKSTIAKSIYTENSKTWISPVSYSALHIAEDYIVVNSWKSGYHELYFINYNGVEIKNINVKDASITAYYGSDEAGKHYYQVAAPTPLDRTVRCIDAKGKVTELSPEAGTSAATFSPDMRFMMLQHSNSTTPPVYTLNTANGKTVRTLQDNAGYAAKYAGKAGKRQFKETTIDGIKYYYYVLLPDNYVEGKKYPTVMYQYSGPESQEVRNVWNVDWQEAFAEEGYVVICADVRGTGNRERSFCDVVYRNLGHYETIDHIAMARHAATLPYVDADRIGICGWSYGGYETLMAVTAEDNPYKAAVSIAPVTDWRFYDSIYAERYMLTPQQNEDGYNSSAPISRAHRLNCPLLLMHGTADDNVHPSNTYEFVSRLQSAGILCDMLMFPNMNHSINYCNARAVVYAKMLDWFNKNLK